MPQDLSYGSIKKFIEIKEIKDDLIVLQDDSLRAVLMATSLNFALKSTDEQDAIIYQYQGVLNSLDFSVQIMVASRKFNIEPYLQMLNFKYREQENELLRLQTNEYINFIQALTQSTNVMTESFYVVVPFVKPKLEKISFYQKWFKATRQKPEEESEQSFKQMKTQLWQRLEFVANAFRSAGVKTALLNTEELIELFYKLYNPTAKGDVELDKAKDLRLQ